MDNRHDFDLIERSTDFNLFHFKLVCCFFLVFRDVTMLLVSLNLMLQAALGRQGLTFAQFRGLQAMRNSPSTFVLGGEKLDITVPAITLA